MIFLTQWMLYGLAAVALPVIIHLLQRRRVVQVPFSTLRFLKLIIAKTSRRSRIENLLLLLLRCLIYTLLILAAARPAMSPQAASFLGGNVPRTIVLIVDNSMSMNYRIGETPRLETAKKQAIAIVDDLKPGDDVALIAVNERAALLIPEPTVAHNLVKQMIQGIPPTQFRTDFSPALREARKILAKTMKKVKRVYLLTDCQELGWRFDAATVFDDGWKQMGAKLFIVRPDDVKSLNGAITKLTVVTPVVNVGAPVRGMVTVENFSAAPLQDLVGVQVGKERVFQRAVEVGSDSTVEVPFEFVVPSVQGTTLRATASLQGDHLPDDDRFSFWLPISQAPKVLVVEGQRVGPDVLHSGFFLRKALGLGATSLPKAISVSELDTASLDGYTALFLVDLPRFTDIALVKLERFLQTGGTVVISAGDQTTPEALGRLAFLPVKAGVVRELPPGRLVVRTVDPAHPLLANTWDANTPFPALPQQKALTLELKPEAKVLLSLHDDTPFLVVADRGAGKVMLINASADRSWGDFPLSAGAFVPLMQQIARWSSEQFTKSGSFHVSDALPLPTGLAKAEGLTVTQPNGVVHTVPAQNNGVAVERAEQAGFFELSSPTEGVLQLYSVNTPVAESSLKLMEESALKQKVPHELAKGTDGLKLALDKDRELTPLWPLLLMGALIAFGAETMIANVMARNRSQADVQHIRTGRLNKRRMGRLFHATVEVGK